MARAPKPPRSRSSAGARLTNRLPALEPGEAPHSLEAEVSVLGAMLLNNETIDVVVPLLRSESFFSAAHQTIYESVVALHEGQRAVDLVTLRDELERRGALQSVGGSEYIASLVDAVPAASNIEHYVEIVREKSIVRDLLTASREILDEARQTGVHSRELLDQAQARIFRIAEEGTRAALTSIREVLKVTFERIDSAKGREGMLTGVATGFPDLDELTSGLQDGELIIVAARPSMGKTTFALNIVDHVGVDLKQTVGVFSLEMSREQLARNMLCSRAGIDGHRLRRGRLQPNESTKLAIHVGALSEAPIFIDDSASLNTFELRAKVRRLKAQHGCRLVVIDYLQLMQGPDSESRQIEISSISRSLKGLAREMNVPVIAVAQLNRQVENRPDKRPHLADLRESGAIEQDADVVMLLHRPAYYSGDTNDCTAEVIVAKQRNGPTGKVDLRFISRHLRFASASQEPVDS